MEAKLPATLAAKTEPGNLNEQLDWAWFCQLPSLHRYATAVRFYAKAFAEKPELASEPRNTHIHRASRAAAKAATSADENDIPLSEAERASLRGQALDWLRTELAIWSKQAQSTMVQDQRARRRTLSQWQLESDLASVRDPAALAKLPEHERKAWQEFWQEVQKTLPGPPSGNRFPGQ